MILGLGRPQARFYLARIEVWGLGNVEKEKHRILKWLMDAAQLGCETTNLQASPRGCWWFSLLCIRLTYPHLCYIFF